MMIGQRLQETHHLLVQYATLCFLRQQAAASDTQREVFGPPRLRGPSVDNCCCVSGSYRRGFIFRKYFFRRGRFTEDDFFVFRGKDQRRVFGTFGSSAARQILAPAGGSAIRIKLYVRTPTDHVPSFTPYQQRQEKPAMN